MSSTLVIPEYVRYNEPRWRGQLTTHQGEWNIICSTEICYAFPTPYFRPSIEDILDRLRGEAGYKLYDGTFSRGLFQQSNVRSLLEFDCTFDDTTLISILHAIYPRIKFTKRFGHCGISNGNYLGALIQLLEKSNW